MYNKIYIMRSNTCVCVCVHKTRNAIKHIINYNNIVRIYIGTYIVYNVCAACRSRREDCVAWEAGEERRRRRRIYHIPKEYYRIYLYVGIPLYLQYNIYYKNT